MMELDFSNFDRVVQQAIKDRADMAEYRELTQKLANPELSGVERRCLRVMLDALESSMATEDIDDSDYTSNSIYN